MCTTHHPLCDHLFIFYHYLLKTNENNAFNCFEINSVLGDQNLCGNPSPPPACSAVPVCEDVGIAANKRSILEILTQVEQGLCVSVLCYDQCTLFPKEFPARLIWGRWAVVFPLIH